MNLSRILIVAGGTFIGALLRWGLEWSVMLVGGPREAALWTVNVLGALALGFLTGWGGWRQKRLETFAAPGVLAGFTTYSGMIAFTDAATWLAMPMVGVAACFGGLLCGRRVAAQQAQRQVHGAVTMSADEPETAASSAVSRLAPLRIPALGLTRRPVKGVEFREPSGPVASAPETVAPERPSAARRHAVATAGRRARHEALRKSRAQKEVA